MYIRAEFYEGILVFIYIYCTFSLSYLSDYTFDIIDTIC